MNKLSSIARRMLVGLALPMASTMGLAQTPSDLGRVDVSGSTAAQVVKFNVQQVCPQIAAELQANLDGMVRRFGERSDVRVDFKLSGNEVSAINTPFLPAAAALPIKRAVSGLSCEGTGGHSEHYAFLINFVNADSATGTSVATRQAPDQIASLTVLGR